MKIYTSYWAQVRNFPPNLIALNTTIFPPKWYKIGGKDKNNVISLHCPPLRPGKSCNGLCNGKCNPKHPQDCSFLREYRKQLDTINFSDFIKKLSERTQRFTTDFPEIIEFNFAFIVFEKYDNPCSEREVIQAWFKDNGFDIQEWHPNT